jgi:hypothetical protein
LKTNASFHVTLIKDDDLKARRTISHDALAQNDKISHSIGLGGDIFKVTLVKDDEIGDATLVNSDGCPKTPISTFDPVGRLGNTFSSYANYIAIQWQLGYRLYLPARTKAELSAILENVTFPTISSLRKCGIKNWHKQKKLEDFFNTVFQFLVAKSKT